MNIFVLDFCPKKSAEYLNDKHTIKMCLESAQILCTVLREFNYEDDYFYKSTHKNHPCVKWVMKSKSNYLWLLTHAICIGKEYTFRYNKIHKSSIVTDKLPIPNDKFFDTQGLTDFVLCMNDKYKLDCPVESYRNYYFYEKNFGWNKTRKCPKWFERS